MIAFQSPREGGPPQIYVMHADGTEQKRLTNLRGFAGVPDWSPDCKRILFQVNENPTLQPAHWQIYLINANGSGLKPLTHDGFNDQVPKWSPDGLKIVFFSDKTGNNQIYTMLLDGSHWHRITNNRWDDSSGTWSPDGRKIAFTSDRGSGTDVYVMNADGTSERRLTSDHPGLGIPFFPLMDRGLCSPGVPRAQARFGS